jgi:hypothetical protein
MSSLFQVSLRNVRVNRYLLPTVRQDRERLEDTANGDVCLV